MAAPPAEVSRASVVQSASGSRGIGGGAHESIAAAKTAESWLVVRSHTRGIRLKIIAELMLAYWAPCRFGIDRSSGFAELAVGRRSSASRLARRRTSAHRLRAPIGRAPRHPASSRSSLPLRPRLRRRRSPSKSHHRPCSSRYRRRALSRPRSRHPPPSRLAASRPQPCRRHTFVRQDPATECGRRFTMASATGVR